MPTDPRTGQRLPGEAGLYAGEPGAPADAPPMAPGAAGPGGEPTEAELMAMAAEADAMLGDVGAATAPGEEMAAEGEMPAEGGEDMTPLVEALGITPEQAQSLYDAAQQMPDFAGVPPAELAIMLANDFDLRMRLEQLAAGASDTPMPPEEMPPAGAEGEAMPPEEMPMPPMA